MEARAEAAIDKRDAPIPLYGELGSVNPVVVLPSAAAQRGAEIATGLFASFTGSAGQLCTKPGLAFIPSDSAGDRLVDMLSDLVAAADSAVVLNAGIRDVFNAKEAALERTGARASRGMLRPAPHRCPL